MLNAGVWENRSIKLLAINLGYEVVWFALQGAILAVWQSLFAGAVKRRG